MCDINSVQMHCDCNLMNSSSCLSVTEWILVFLIDITFLASIGPEISRMYNKIGDV